MNNFLGLVKKNKIYIIILLGLLLRIFSYINHASYEDYDGYLSFGRILYESKAFGRDRQFFELHASEKNHNIDNLFNNPSLPITNKNGKEIILIATHPVGWPLQIAIVYSIFGKNNVDAVLIYNLIISSLTILLFYLIARSLFNTNIALISSLIVSLNPIFILSSSWATTETNFLFFLMLAIYFFIKSNKTHKVKFYILFGGIIGFTSLVRPVAFLYILILLFLLFVVRKFHKKLVISLISFIIVLSPWIIRNYIVFNSFIPMTNLSSFIFLQGNNKVVFENKSGSWVTHEPILLRKDSLIFAKNSEVEINRISRREGFKFLKSLSFLELIQHEWYKIRYAFGLSTKYFLYRPGTFNFSIKDKLVYYPLLFLTMIYFLFFYKKSEKNDKSNIELFLIIFFACIIVFLTQTLIFYGFPRYRAYLLDPILIFTTSFSLCNLFKIILFRRIILCQKGD